MLYFEYCFGQWSKVSVWEHEVVYSGEGIQFVAVMHTDSVTSSGSQGMFSFAVEVISTGQSSVQLAKPTRVSD